MNHIKVHVPLNSHIIWTMGKKWNLKPQAVDWESHNTYRFRDPFDFSTTYEWNAKEKAGAHGSHLGPCKAKFPYDLDRGKEAKSRKSGHV